MEVFRKVSALLIPRLRFGLLLIRRLDHDKNACQQPCELGRSPRSETILFPEPP